MVLNVSVFKNAENKNKFIIPIITKNGGEPACRITLYIILITSAVSAAD